MAAGKAWQRVDGVLLLDKPSGITSNAALQQARRLFSAAKAGHTGTLDPLASGLLPLCFGEATKFAHDLLAADKSYEAEVCFGIATDTGDADGAVVRRCPIAFDAAALNDALARLRGPLEQIPPMHSALKHQGRALYTLARQGIEVERSARQITIHRLQLIDFSGERCRLHVRCSKGTYVRSLAVELGEALACAAHLSALRRTAVGSLQVADALPLAALAELSAEERTGRLLPLDHLLQGLPAVRLDEAAALRFRHGNPVGDAQPPGSYRVYDAAGRLLGVGESDDERPQLRPRRVVGVA